MSLRVIALSVFFAMVGQSRAESPDQTVINIISGSVGGTYARIAQDISNVVYAEDSIRVFPILGRGSVQNIHDLMLLSNPEIHLAIVQNDVLDYLKTSGGVKNIDNKINYICKLYNEEIHFIAKETIASLKDLDGGVVSVDRAGSGTDMTATVLFSAIGIEVRKEHLTYAEALEALETGSIDAMVAVVGKPAAFVKDVPADKGFHFVSIEMTKDLEDRYFDAELTSADYPGLIAEGETVPTIAVGAVLASYNFTSTRKRERLTQFTNEFFSLIDEFKSGPYHEKWKEVDIRAVVPNWKRFDEAERWLSEN